MQVKSDTQPHMGSNFTLALGGQSMYKVKATVWNLNCLLVGLYEETTFGCILLEVEVKI
jgi:hypothetical protein